MNILLVFLGAGLGGALRYGSTALCARLWGVAFPTGTLMVNVVGSLLMGLLVGYLLPKVDISPGWRLFLGTGVLGGFTTFSAFSFDALSLAQQGNWLGSAVYILGSVVLSIAALGLGLWLMK
jgi:fluoride exporter